MEILHRSSLASVEIDVRVRIGPLNRENTTGVNPAGDAGDTSPQYFGWGTSTGISPPILLRTFGYSRPILVAFRSLSLKPISFGYKTPPIRFSQAGGQSAHKARPPDLELALTPLENTRRFRRLMGTPFVNTPVPTLGGRCRGACVRQQFSPA